MPRPTLPEERRAAPQIHVRPGNTPKELQSEGREQVAGCHVALVVANLNWLVIEQVQIGIKVYSG